MKMRVSPGYLYNETMHSTSAIVRLALSHSCVSQVCEISMLMPRNLTAPHNDRNSRPGQCFILPLPESVGRRGSVVAIVHTIDRNQATTSPTTQPILDPIARDFPK
jgi:hypothetical protein